MLKSDKQDVAATSAYVEEAIDRWFSFVEEWNKNSTVPLSQVLLPDSPGNFQGLRTPGSPTGAFDLTKRELKKLGVI